MKILALPLRSKCYEPSVMCDVKTVMRIFDTCHKWLKSLENLLEGAKSLWSSVGLLDKAKHNVKHNVMTLHCH
jgi:hypothetical protein